MRERVTNLVRETNRAGIRVVGEDMSIHQMVLHHVLTKQTTGDPVRTRLPRGAAGARSATAARLVPTSAPAAAWGESGWETASWVSADLGSDGLGDSLGSAQQSRESRQPREVEAGAAALDLHSSAIAGVLSKIRLGAGGNLHQAYSMKPKP